jgi:hypothetical protein
MAEKRLLGCCESESPTRTRSLLLSTRRIDASLMPIHVICEYPLMDRIHAAEKSTESVSGTPSIDFKELHHRGASHVFQIATRHCLVKFRHG